MLLGSVLPALIGLAASFLFGPMRAIGMLVNLGADCIVAVLFIKSARELKARKPQFFDTLVLALVINVVGYILYSLFNLRGVSGVIGLITSTIVLSIALAISLCIYIMYYSKSVRVKVYFDGRPVHNSKYWNWIKLLPAFIISETATGPNNTQQTGGAPQQSHQESQQLSYPAQAEDKPVFCGECGAKNVRGTKFCGSCGKPIA